jgi:hypothetical protein
MPRCRPISTCQRPGALKGPLRSPFARTGRDLPLPRPLKGTILAAIPPGIWRMSAERSVSNGDPAMSATFRLSIGSHAAAIAVGAVAVATYLTVYSAGPQSLADYISAICAKSFGTASAAEAPYLAENVSAMTKMMIDIRRNPRLPSEPALDPVEEPHSVVRRLRLRTDANSTVVTKATPPIQSTIEMTRRVRAIVTRPSRPSTSKSQPTTIKFSFKTIDPPPLDPINIAPHCLIFIPPKQPRTTNT